MRKLLPILIALALAGAACGDDDTTATNNGEVPAAVVEGVRAQYPQTSVDGIAMAYSNITANVPNPSDDEAVEWIVQLEKWNAAVEAWNRCLEEVDETGARCDEADETKIFSVDNPLNWQ